MRELRLDGPVVIGESDTDPGDMGEPRQFVADGVTYVTVPPVEAWGLPSETQVWERLEALILAESGIVTIYPAYHLRDGGFGPWTFRYEVQTQHGRRARYKRVYGEGPSRIQALYALAMQLLRDDDSETPVREIPEPQP